MSAAQTSPRAQLIVPCDDLDAAINFYTDHLGFRLDMIMPADAPRIAVVSGYGMALRLETCDAADAGHPPLRIHLTGEPARWPGDAGEALVAPGGVRIERSVEAASVMSPGGDSLLIERAKNKGAWGDGRAGMQYRDLVPGRLGGAFIASHIRIPEGGPVPDYVHYHRVGFQMIFCRRGWVKVVYEDQGPPFVMHAGDCVLQPPMIRHRVLESSPGLEVLEIGCPAEHETWRDHDLGLPNEARRPQRSFAGQRFVRHIAEHAVWRQDAVTGFETCDTGIGEATDGLADVRVVRNAADVARSASLPADTVCFLFVLQGGLMVLGNPGTRHPLKADDACLVHADAGHGFEAAAGCEFLQLAMPRR